MTVTAQQMPEFEVWREDDNGHRHRVARWLDEASAHRLLKRLEARAHKQWFEVVASPAGA